MSPSDRILLALIIAIIALWRHGGEEDKTHDDIPPDAQGDSMFTRDSLVWTITLIGSVLTFLLGHQELLQEAFPGLDPVWEKRIELGAAVMAFIAGVCHMSPINSLSARARQKFADRDNRVDPKRLPNGGSGLVLVLAVALGASTLGCAQTASALVTADKAVYDVVSKTQDTMDRLCDAKLMTPADCRQFNAELVPVIDEADAFNRAVRANSTAEIPAMLGSLTRLGNAVMLLLPDEAQRAEIRARIEYARGLLQSIWAK